MRFFAVVLLLLATSTVIAEVGKPPGTTLPFPPIPRAMSLGPNPHHLSAEACRECHQEIYNQWAGSMHAKSTALKDPIHEAFYRSEVGDPRREGERHNRSGTYPVCLKCHAPNAARDGKTKLDAMPAYSEGVNCLTCHLIKGYKGVLPDEPGGRLRLGIDAYEWSDILQSPTGKIFAQIDFPKPPPGSGAATPSFHPFAMEGNAAMLRSPQLCLGCHERRNNPHGVPLCNTGEEFRDSNHFNCQQCHMPVNHGFADHSMGGGHSPEMLRRGVVMTLAINREEGEIQAEVVLQNTLPHNMPTGAPFRNLYLQITAFDRNGMRLWQNYRHHPLREDPDSLFMLTLLDKEGKPSAPPQAVAQGSDTRLAPHERRILNYTLPATNVAMVRADLYYDLLSLPLKERFTAVPQELKQPTLVARSEKLVE